MRALTSAGWGSWSDPIYFQPGKGVINPTSSNDSKSGISGTKTTIESGSIVGVSPIWIILIIVAVIVVVLVVALLACARRNGSNDGGKQLSDLDCLDANMYKG